MLNAMNAPGAKTPVSRPPVSVADLLALPGEGQGYEILDGALVDKETSAEHSFTQTKLAAHLDRRFGRRPGGRWPGGWWFLTESLVVFPGLKDPLRPDVAGWRREKVPERPRGSVVSITPDWICEILSPGNATNDTIKKKRIYHHAHVGHYWLLDPVAETLQVYRWTPEGYTEILSVERNERVRAEPFEAVEIAVMAFFGDDDDDE